MQGGGAPPAKMYIVANNFGPAKRCHRKCSSRICNLAPRGVP